VIVMKPVSYRQRRFPRWREVA